MRVPTCTILILSMVAPLFAAPSRCDAAITWTIDQEQWFAETGDVTSIFFTELKEIPVTITDQYEHLGMTAPSSSTLVARPFDSPDMVGMSNFDPDAQARIDFSLPIQAVGLEIRGDIGARFYFESEFLGASPILSPAPAGEIGFIGLATEFVFDAVVLFDVDNGIAVDNLHFQTIPAPSAFALLACAVAHPRRRRR